MKKMKILTGLLAIPTIGLSAISFVGCSQTDVIKDWKISFQATEGATLSFTELKLKEGQIVKWSQLEKPEVQLSPGYREIGWFDSTDYVFPDLCEEDLEIKSDTVLKYLVYNENETLIRVKLVIDDKSVTCPAIAGFTWADFKEFYGIVDPQKEHFKFVGWMDKKTQTILKDDDAIVSAMIIEAKFEQLESDFSYDSWDVVISHAQKGLDDLKSFYKKDSFIGLERTIKLNGQIHKVRVIGENHDTISEGPSKGKTAALTFELANMVSNKYGYTLCVQWLSKNFEYQRSDLYKNLNSETEVIWREAIDGEWFVSQTCNKSCLTMLKEENPSLFNALQTVTKQTLTTGEYKLTDYEAKIFPLSCSEMALTYDGVLEQGKPYKFWELNEKQASEGARMSGRIKRNTKGLYEKEWYHLTSPYTKSQTEVMAVHTTGAYEKVWTNDAEGVSFAFCI